MQKNKLIAKIVGGLFITGTAAGILSVVFAGPLLDDSDYLTKISQNETQMVVGSIFVMIMAFSLAMIPVLLFPIFKKYSEILALGAILFRGVLEAFAYLTVTLTWLSLIVLSQQYTSTTDIATLQLVGTLLLGVEDWATQILSIVFSLGALMIYWLFYVSRLIPRWLSVWGLIGAVLYLTTPLLTMFGVDQFGALVVPLAVQEMILAFWLIFKGFSVPATSSKKL